jgi:hypothetical protein
VPIVNAWWLHLDSSDPGVDGPRLRTAVPNHQTVTRAIEETRMGLDVRIDLGFHSGLQEPLGSVSEELREGIVGA